MTARPRRCLSLLAASATLALPAAAAAQPQPLSGPLSSAAPRLSAPAQLRELVRQRTAQAGGQPSLHPAFLVKSSDGYLVEVVGSGDQVVIYVVRGRHARAATAYVARGTGTGNRIAAGFGKFGKVSMRFKESRRRSWAKPNRVCEGSGRFENRLGTFVGEFTFRGEGGYLSVQTRRAKGQVSEVAPRCRAGAGRRAKLATHPTQESFWGPERPYLLSDWRHGVSSARFAAVRDKKTIFLASTEQAHGKFAIFRLALRTATSPQALKVSNALTSARVSPPAPFSGVGSYRAAPDGTVSWTGPLTVNFPGAPHYPLTGPPFEASVGTTADPFFPFF